MQWSLSRLGRVIMIGGGAWYVIKGELNMGQFVAIQGYWWWLYGPLNFLSQLNDIAQRALAGGRRIYQVLDAENEIVEAPGARPLEAMRGEVRFERARFRYRTGNEVLAGIDLGVEPGQTVALVGHSGSGKSTMLMLIPRFYDLTGGTLLVDGRDVKGLPLADLRRQVGVVLQETYLFNSTVAENIRYGRPDASPQEVRRAAEMANADEFIEELAEGYGTTVGERGVKLSGGQKQRIAIARAFLSEPRILILDEATSAVEPESERVIQEALVRLMAGRTTFITSHRYSMLRDADSICVLSGGLITERGTHDELIAAGGL